MTEHLFNGLYKLPISDSFKLHIQTNYNYNFENEIIKAEGVGYYNTKHPKSYDNRFYLELSIRDKGKTLTAIMMNPSNTFPKQNDKSSMIDDTVKNVIRMAYRLNKYSKIVVLNSFPLIVGTYDNNNAQNNEDEKIKINLEIIENYISANKNSDYLLAWGGKAKDTDKICNFIKANNIPPENICVYKLTKKGYPCHPSRIVENRYKYVSKFLDSKNPSFDIYKIK